MKIEQTVSKYQATKCEVAFGEIYNNIYAGSRKIVTNFSRKYKLDEADVESMINMKILEVANTYDSTKGRFRNEVFSAIKFGSIDLVRKKVYRDDKTADVMLADDDGNNFEVYEVKDVAPTTSVPEIVEETQKKHDQRQLTAFLLSKVSEPILTSALAYVKSESYREAAELAGTTDKTVKARILKISRHFSSEKFGDYRDYLSVPTEKAV